MNDAQSGRYVADTEGAPPVPPPGGYRGATRAAQAAARPASPGDAVETARIERPKRRLHWWGWVALSAAVLFALVLLVLVMLGRTSDIFGVTALAAQVLVIGCVIAALVNRRARPLGIAALAVALLANVSTIGGAGALRTSATGEYRVTKSAEEAHWDAYPGVKDRTDDDSSTLYTLEDARDENDRLMREIREAVSEKYGYTWTKTAPESARPMRNGYGGESMLQSVQFETWTTNEPIHDLSRKREVMATINEVLGRKMLSLYPLNESGHGVPDTTLEDLYGAVDPDDQAIWEWAATEIDMYVQYEALILDLSRDPSGDFEKQARAKRAKKTDPVEGLSLTAYGELLLPEDDADEYDRRMEKY